MPNDKPSIDELLIETVEELGERLQPWVYERLRFKPTVAAASEAMKVSSLAVAEAVGAHYWMFLTGDLSSAETARIDADGE